MESEVILDTNNVAALFKKDVALQQRLAQVATVWVPSTVLGELYYGAYHSARVVANLAAIEHLLPLVTIAPVDEGTAQLYGLIRQELTSIGRPIPENDMWIAAVARQRGLPLVSRDAHFDVVPGLTRRAW